MEQVLLLLEAQQHGRDVDALEVAHQFLGLQLDGRGVLVEAPDAEAGSVLMHNIIPRLSGTPGRFRLPAPDLGQHSRSVLESIGLTTTRIDALAADGVIKDA